MSKYYKLTIHNNGGEFSFGIWRNESQRKLILDKIKDGTLELENYDDDVEVSFSENTLLTYVNGPYLNKNTTVSLEYCADEFGEDIIQKIISSQELSEQFNEENIIYSFPYLNQKLKDKFPDTENLLFGGSRVEKRLDYQVIIKLDDNEVFSFENIYIYVVNMSKIYKWNDTIISKIFYIREEEANNLLKNEYGDNTDKITLTEYMRKVYSEAVETNTNVEQFDLFALEQINADDSSGVYGSEYAVVRNMKDDILFEEELDRGW